MLLEFKTTDCVIASSENKNKEEIFQQIMIQGRLWAQIEFTH